MKKLFVVLCLLISQNIFAKSEECEALKKPTDIMDTYVFAEQINSVSEANYNGKMYRDIFSSVNKFLYDKCDSTPSKDFFEDAQSMCAIACESNSRKVESDKKKAESMAKDCKSICRIEILSRQKVFEGMTMKSSDCSNPSKDEISNLGRNVKTIEKKTDESKVKSTLPK